MWTALLSVLAAVTTVGIKFLAYYLTGSVGLLSDALESGINLLASLVAMLSLWYASRPADVSHAYGHEKIEFFSSGLEGGLILAAAVGIVLTAVPRLIHPTPLEALGLGTGLAVVAAGVNFAVAQVLLRVGKAEGSIVLEADGHHLMTDVWTSVAVVGAVLAVGLTGWQRLDPLIALAVAGMIVWTAVDLLRRSFDGLMDRSLPADEVDELIGLIRAELPPGCDFHALRTRRGGTHRFADFHLLVPGGKRVREAHALADRIEEAVRRARPNLELTIHIEPIEEEG
jgi:cation diffusion facilitator family transporter